MERPADALSQAVRAAGFDLVAEPDASAPLDAQLDAALSAGAEVVFAAGGDGTLRAVAERLVGTGVALAVVPGGTMNRLAERLGLPADPVAAVAAFRPGRAGALDVAMAGAHVFLYQSIVGPPARLLRFREMQRGPRAMGWGPLLRAMLRTLLRRPDRSVVLVAAHGLVRHRGHAAIVTAPQPGSDGLLEVSIAQPGGAWAKLRQAWRWIRRELPRDPAVVALEANRAALHGPTPVLRLSLDGEMRVVPAPVRFRVRRAALPVLLPA
jgi:diacylglycerol kinase family enzyme